MLTIKFTNKKKNLIECKPLNLRKNIALLLQGDKQVIERYYVALYQRECCMSQGNTMIAQTHVDRQIAYLTYDSMKHSKQRIDRYIRSYCDQEQMLTILNVCHLQDRPTERFYRLTQEERICLQLQVCLTQKPFLWVLRGDWNQASLSLVEHIQQVLQDYETLYGCYIIANIEAQCLFPIYDVYDCSETDKQLFYANYLEEDVQVRDTSHKTPKQKHLSYVLKIGIFLILICAITNLCFIYIFSFQTSIANVQRKSKHMEETQVYPFDISICDTTSSTQYMVGCQPYTPQEVNQFLQDILPVAFTATPIYEAMLDFRGTASSYFYDEQKEKVEIGPELFIDTVSVRTFHKETLDKQIISQFQEDGIYLSDDFAKRVFKGQEIRGLYVHMHLLVPMYNENLYDDHDQNGEFNADIRYDPLYKLYEADIPVAGIIEQEDGTGIYLDQSYFEKIQKEIGYGEPYDITQKDTLISPYRSNINYEALSIYYPTQYKLSTKTKEDAKKVDTLLQKGDSKIIAHQSYREIEESLRILYTSQNTIRSMLFPYVLGGSILTIVYALWLRRSKRSFVFSLTKTSMLKQLGVCVVCGIIVGSILYFLAYRFSSVDVEMLFHLITQNMAITYDFYNSNLALLIFGIANIQLTTVSWFYFCISTILLWMLLYMLEWIKKVKVKFYK